MTVIKRSLTIKEAVKYISDLTVNKQKKEAIQRIRDDMVSHLHSDVYQNSLDRIWDIGSLSIMRNLIQTGVSPKRAFYHPQYRRWKEYFGLPPHEITGTMKQNTFIEIVGDHVEMWIPLKSTQKSKMNLAMTKMYSFNYGFKHERRKSVLKATAVFAWNDIIKSLLKAYVPT